MSSKQIRKSGENYGVEVMDESFNGPATMFLNRLINVCHEGDCLCQGSYNALVVPNIIKRYHAAFAIFEPLVADLVAADMKFPYMLWHSIKILCLIYEDTTLLRLLVRHQIFHLLHHVIAIDGIHWQR